jgi:hypothetical protein
MWKRIKMMYRNVPEDFYTLSHLALPKGLFNGLSSKIYYTPKLQKFGFTEELDKYLRFLNRKDKIKVGDLRSLTEAILTEYGVIHGLEGHPIFKDNLNFSITKNYEFQAN